MRTEILSLVCQALFFIFGVYLEKFIRSTTFSPRTLFFKDEKKAIEANYEDFHMCNHDWHPSLLQFQRKLWTFLDRFLAMLLHYFWLHADLPFDCGELSSLWLAHLWKIYQRVTQLWEIQYQEHIDCTYWHSQAPLLEELLFRASFFRTSSDQVSIFILALIFSISKFEKR